MKLRKFMSRSSLAYSEINQIIVRRKQSAPMGGNERQADASDLLGQIQREFNGRELIWSSSSGLCLGALEIESIVVANASRPI